jgi:hypothetical protein
MADLKRRILRSTRFRLVAPGNVGRSNQMVITLGRRGLIERTPGVARSILVLVPLDQLPELE